MAALQVTGRIKSIGATQSIASKNGGQPFQKREIILDTTRFDPYTGERDKYENYPMFEFGGEKCKDLDDYQVGQVVTVSFDLQGSFYKDKDGVDRNFTKVRAYKIEARQTSQTVQQPQQPQQKEQSQPPQQQQPYQQPYRQPYQQPQNGAYANNAESNGLPW